MTQNKQLLEHFQKGGSITQLEAFGIFQICRLSERIRELKKQGYYIDKRREANDNGKRYMRYWMPNG